MSSSRSTSPQSSRASSSHRDVEPDVVHLELTNGTATSSTPTLTTPLTLSDAVACLRSSPGWIGNSAILPRDTEWSEDSQSGSMFLRVKSGVAPGSFPLDQSGNVVVSWVGMVGAKDSSISAHGQFQSWFKDPARHKRVVRTIRPPVDLFPQIDLLWPEQLKGAKVVVEKSRRMENGSEPKVGYCFLEDDTGALKARSALFQKDGSPWEGDTPEGFQYSTWNIPSDVRTVFDTVRANNHTPRVLEAYDSLDNLIHPNDVARRLTGSIVYVTCTLEKILFRGQKVPGGRQWQVYANIKKVRLIDTEPNLLSPVASSLKRKAPELEDDGKLPHRPLKRSAPTV